MSRKSFRLLLIAYAVSYIGIVLEALYFPLSVSEELAAAYAAEPLPWLAQYSTFLLGLAIAIFGAGVVGAIGLFFFKKWARTLSLCATVFTLMVIPFLGPSLDSGLGITVSQFSAMLWGAILFSTFLPPLRDAF